MKLYLLLAASLLLIDASAQHEGTIVQYYDKDWNDISDSTEAAYFRTHETIADGYMLRDYFISGRLQMVAPCSELVPKPVFHGKATWYYENGNVREESYFNEGDKKGMERTYHESGKPASIIRHGGDKPVYIHHYDEAGVDQLQHGSGLFKARETALLREYTLIADSTLIAYYAVTLASGDTTYNIAQVQAEYKDGLSGLSKYLAHQITYPKDARRRGIEGTVFISFTVDKLGRIGDVGIVRGVSPSLDAESTRVVKAMPPWKPGTVLGKPVKSRFVLPLKFKLAG